MLTSVLLLAALAVVLGACGSSGGEVPAELNVPPSGEGSASGPTGGEAASGGGSGEAPEEVSGEPPATAEAVRVAYTKTAAKTARMDFKIHMVGLPENLYLKIQGEGVVDLGSGNASYTMRMDGMPGMPEMGAFEVRQIGTTVYEKLPEEVRAEMPEGKPWMRVDLDAFDAGEAGSAGVPIGGSGANDFGEQLSYLQAVSGSVEELDKVRVHGAPTTHYRAEIDIQKIAGEDKPTEETMEQLRELLGSDKLPVELWVGDDGLLRRFEMRIPLPDEYETRNGAPAVIIAQEFYDFGIPIDVQPPPPEKVTDLGKMMAELQDSLQQDA